MTLTEAVHEMSQKRIGALVAERPATARVFETHQLDYCCKGSQTLAAACAERGLDLSQLCDELERVTAASQEQEPDWLADPLRELCDHIERRYHDWLRSELPRLAMLIDKVVKAHGSRHPEWVQVQATFQRLRAELEPHMMKEEQILFPAIRQMEAAGRRQSFPFGTVENPIRCMVQEHEGAGAELTRLRELTKGYAPPQDACPTFRVLLDGLRQLELDMHQHVHKENNILFPRAVELEAALSR